MQALIGLVFLLGLVSIIVPLKFLGITTRRRGGIVIAASFALSMIHGLIVGSPTSVTPSASSTASATLSTTPSPSGSATVTQSNWHYSSNEDKMRA